MSKHPDEVYNIVEFMDNGVRSLRVEKYMFDIQDWVSIMVLPATDIPVLVERIAKMADAGQQKEIIKRLLGR